MTAAATPSLGNLPLSGCTYGWLYHEPLYKALRCLAEHGFSTFELTTAPPHLSSSGLGAFEKFDLLRTMRNLGLQPVSINPGFLDINLISSNPEFQKASERQMAAEIDLASDVGARIVVLIPGRRHALAPAPEDACRWLLEDALGRLTTRAERRGITLTLENNPYGFLGSADEQFALVESIDSPHLGLTYDVANALAVEDPCDGLRRVRSRLKLAHVSDTWRNRWAHTSIGRGEVNFAAFAETLVEIGFTGPTVYELVDGEPPGPRLDADLELLRRAGWSPQATDLFNRQGQ